MELENQPLPKKKYESFDDPFDTDLLGEADLDLGDFDLQSLEPTPRPPSRPRATASEVVFRSMHRADDKERPLQGNYQYVNLLLPVETAERLERIAKAHKMMMQPFMRWVVDQMALIYEEGERPTGWEDVNRPKKRVAALIAPMMTDLLRSWAKENRMKFQPFMRWLAFAFMEAYQTHGIRPQEPEEFIPDEAALFHWASLTVEKFSGTGRKKSNS